MRNEIIEALIESGMYHAGIKVQTIDSRLCVVTGFDCSDRDSICEMLADCLPVDVDTVGDAIHVQSFARSKERTMPNQDLWHADEWDNHCQ